MYTNVFPVQRTILGVGFEGATHRNNVGQARLRADVFDLLEQALLGSGITEDLREPFTDRGDTVLTFIRPDDRVPKTLLMTRFLPLLGERLAHRRLRMAAAVHSGEVHFDQRGPFGEDHDLTLRLLESVELREHLRRTSAPLVLVVSEHIYRSVVRHGYGGLDPGSFHPLVRLRIGGLSHSGWVRMPDDEDAVA